MHCDELGERVDRGETQIARGAAAAAFLLQIFKERTHHRRREIVYQQAVDYFLLCFAQERQQQHQRIPITGLSIVGEITLSDEMLQKEAAHPRAD